MKTREISGKLCLSQFLKNEAKTTAVQYYKCFIAWLHWQKFWARAGEGLFKCLTKILDNCPFSLIFAQNLDFCQIPRFQVPFSLKAWAPTECTYHLHSKIKDFGPCAMEIKVFGRNKGKRAILWRFLAKPHGEASGIGIFSGIIN